MARTEDDLCRIFAEKVRQSPEFASWLLKQTKFGLHCDSARLLAGELIAIRPHVKPERWWRHWWRQLPGSKEQRETDVFLVFEVADGERFALHVEHKRRAVDRFTRGQAESYDRRASSMLNDAKYLDHRDFCTVLIAPTAFRKRNREQADLFSVFISHEDVARFIPEFRAASDLKAEKSV